MDPDSLTKNDNRKKAKASDPISNAGNVLQSIWLRRNSIDSNEVNRILATCEFGFVLPCGFLFWILFLILR